VRLRTEVTKGSGSSAAGIAIAYKLIGAAHTRWRAVNAPHVVALVGDAAEPDNSTKTGSRLKPPHPHRY
jgi:putative transposase